MFSRPGQLRVEAGADLEQRADPPVDLGPSRAGLGDPRQDLEQRALAGAVAADDAEGLALLDLERHVAQGPEDSRPDRLRCRRRSIERTPSISWSRSVSWRYLAEAIVYRLEIFSTRMATSPIRSRPRRRVPSAGRRRGRRGGPARVTATLTAMARSEVVRPDEAPAKPLDHADHGIQAVDDAPRLGHQAQRVHDRRREHPGLDQERDRVIDVAVSDVERRQPQGDREGDRGRQQQEQPAARADSRTGRSGTRASARTG